MDSVGEGQGVVCDSKLMVADGGGELWGEFDEGGMDVVRELVIEWSAARVEVVRAPTFHASLSFDKV